MQKTILAVAGLCLAGSLHWAAAEEAKTEGTETANATPAVTNALKTLFPEGEIKSLVKEQKGKVRRFNAVVKGKDGEHKVQLRADGSIVERVDPVKPEAVPSGIANYLKNKSGKGKIGAATKYTIRNKVTYEVEFENEGKKEKLYFGEDGSEAQAPSKAKEEEEDK